MVLFKLKRNVKVNKGCKNICGINRVIRIFINLISRRPHLLNLWLISGIRLSESDANNISQDAPLALARPFTLSYCRERLTF